MLQLIELSKSLYVSAQPTPEEIASVAEKGFSVVVCNRPDGESDGQPSTADMRAAVEAAGMKFINYPVTPQTFPGEDLNTLAAVFDSDEKVFAYCRSGTRCANLWVASRTPEERDAAAERARVLGFDLSLVNRWAS